MASSKNIHIVPQGSFRCIFANIKGVKYFSKSEKLVTWKQQIIEKEEVSKNPLRLLFTLEDKGRIHDLSKDTMITYTFKKSEVGKYIKFYAYVENFETIQQSTIFYVEDKCNTNIRIRGVERVDLDSSEIAVGQKIKLKVNKYSVDESKVYRSVKESIKWMVKIDNSPDERLIINGLVMTGGEIEFDVPENWIGKEIMFMPYLNIHTPKISHQSQVSSKCILECYWTDENKERIECLRENIKKAYFYIKTVGYDCDEAISVKVSDEDGSDILPGQKEVVIEGRVNCDGEIWVEAYNIKE